MPGLYFHIPFCTQACHYCDFHFSTKMQRMDDVVEAMAKELELQKDYLNDKRLDSIYFGGGTPSLLSDHHFDKIFATISRLFTVSPACETTLEANPDDLAKEKIAALKAWGINRLSIGIQSFNDNILKFLNRTHDGQMAIAALENVRKGGFSNISIDLIYAIPGQDQNVLRDNIRLGLDFSPEHISTYGLTVEQKTVFGNLVSRKKLREVDEMENAAQYQLLTNVLVDSGYEHYEISNFSKKGFHSRHNSNYWKQEPYLGIGPSAHSYNLSSRQFNIRNNIKYLNSIANGVVPGSIEILTKENKINEFVFTTLRTSWGCDFRKLKQDHGFDFLESRGDYINGLVQKKLATLNNDTLQLTFDGKLLADKISLDLMI